MRDDVAPDVRGCRVAMQEQHDGAACARRHIGQGRAEDIDVVAPQLCCHGCKLLNTVANTIDLKRSSGAGLRSTFMRRIAPCHELSRKSASSSALKVVAISPAAWPCAMQAANGCRQHAKIWASLWRTRSFWAASSRLKLPIMQPRAHSAAASRSVMASR